jgi:hypothetical protein
MFSFPTDRKKIASTIRRYERLLRKEQEGTGAISDGFGKRYLVGILYLLLDDTPGAMKSFEWFERTFDDDGSEPFHSLSWTLALYRSGKIEDASRKLRHTMLLNLYIIPHLLGKPQSELQIWHASNWCQKSYLHEVPPGVLELWQPRELDWMQREYNSKEFWAARSRYIDIYARLNHEPVGPLRSQLVAEAGRLEDGED